MGSKAAAITGYRYYFAMLLAMCRGPIDEILRIQVGGINVWGGDTDLTLPLDPDVLKTGDSGTYAGVNVSLTDTGASLILAQNAFGGDSGEGGIKGTFQFLNGKADQTCPPELAGFLGGTIETVPGFRGVASIYFNGTICSNNPYPKTWKMRIRRALKGWDGDVWYPEAAVVALTADAAQYEADASGPYSLRKTYDFYTTQFTYYATDSQLLYTLITPASYSTTGKQVNAVWDAGTSVGLNSIHAMNPAHIIYEAATNRDWGRGLPRSMIDTCSFSESADTLFNEGFGMCLKYNRQTPLNQFVQTVIDHAGGALFIDRGTGLLTFRLIRDDYTVADLPVFDYTSGILSVQDDTAASQDTWYNEIIVTYHDPILDQDRNTRVQNLGSIQALDAIYSNTTSYIGLPTQQLAARVATRDLKSAAAGLKRMTFKMDRRGWKIKPAGVFVVNLPDRGITNLVLRATKIEDGTLADGTMTITALQDVFGLPATAYVGVVENTWSAPDTQLYYANNRLAYEASYRDVIRFASNITLSDTTGAIVTAAKRPSALSLNYGLATATGTETYAQTGGGNWCPTGVLTVAVGPLDTLFTFSAVTDFTTIEVGDAGMIEGEIVRVDAVDTTALTVTVARGCVDTIPAAHAAATCCFFNDGFEGKDGVAYEAGEAVGAKILTRTTRSILGVSLAPTDTVTMAQRHARPFPPANVKYGTTPFYETLTVSGDIVFTWNERNRLLEQDQLVGHTEASISPEAGVTYTFQVFNGTTLLRTASGLTGTTWTYTEDMWTADGSITGLTFALVSVRDSLDSLQPYSISLTHLPAGVTVGYGDGYGYSYGGTST